MRPNPGEVIGGKYRITRLIGDGGMGSVYEARHEVLNTPVALKFLHPEFTKRAGLVSRFMREAKVSASIQSPHVTRVTDVEQLPDGSPYIVMELLQGESLQQLLDRRIKLPADQAIDFTLQMLSGLEAAHALGVVHRDLKPDNVFITPSTGGPIAKLLDFGIAKLRDTNEFKKGLTRPGAIMGTPEYMAPEQAYSADQVDHRADIYSIGAMLYEMLSGERPAYGDEPEQIVYKVTSGQVKRLSEYDASLPAGLVDAVHRAMAPASTHRFATAVDMRLGLAPFAGQLSHAGRLAATPPPGSIVQGATQDLPPLEHLAPETRKDAQGLPPTVPPRTDPGGANPGGNPHQVDKGGTQEVPPGVVEHEVALRTAAGTGTVNAPVQGAQQYGGHGHGHGAGAHPAPHAYTGGAQPYATRAEPRGNRAIWALIAVLLGAGVAAAAIGFYVTRDGDSSDDHPPLTPLDAPPATTITAQAKSPDTPPAPPDSTSTTTPTPTPTSGKKPRPPGTVTKPPASSSSKPPPFPTIQIPSSFPIPSGFPTSLPPFPGFPPPKSSG